jgi:hypothetical protein
MKYKQLLELAKPNLEENDLGVNHTLRVLEIVKNNYTKYNLDETWKDVVFSLIVLHDIGGSEIKDQYEKGPIIAKKLLEKLNYHNFDIKLICGFIERHHERLNDPHDMFKILFDSDQLVKFSKEEFNNYNSRKDFNWQNIMDSLYHPDSKDTAKNLLEQRRKENV